MKYNFDEIIERKGTDSVKWDWAEEGVLPMWVADMDFKTAPEVIQAISDKVSQGVFGYGTIPENFYQSIIDWWEKYLHHRKRLAFGHYRNASFTFGNY